MSLIDEKVALHGPSVRVSAAPKKRSLTFEWSCGNDDVNVCSQGVYMHCKRARRQLEALAVFLGKDDPGGKERLQKRHALATEAARTLGKALEAVMPMLDEAVELGTKQGIEDVKADG